MWAGVCSLFEAHADGMITAKCSEFGQQQSLFSYSFLRGPGKSSFHKLKVE